MATISCYWASPLSYDPDRWMPIANALFSAVATPVALSRSAYGNHFGTQIARSIADIAAPIALATLTNQDLNQTLGKQAALNTDNGSNSHTFERADADMTDRALSIGTDYTWM